MFLAGIRRPEPNAPPAVIPEGLCQGYNNKTKSGPKNQALSPPSSVNVSVGDPVPKPNKTKRTKPRLTVIPERFCRGSSTKTKQDQKKQTPHYRHPRMLL